jgi:predicted negative regulator of RcsB-dependent stress response
MAKNQDKYGILSYKDPFVIWLSSHVRHVLAGALVLILLVSGAFYLVQRHTIKLESASETYGRVLRMLEYRTEGEWNDKREEMLIDLIDEIEEEYPKLIYADYVSLLRVRITAEEGRYNEALDTLDEILLRPDLNKQMRAFSVLQKARILIDIERFQEAVDLMNDTDSDFLSAAFLELRGDVLVRLERWEQALQYYKGAGRLYEQGASVPLSLRVKLQFVDSQIPEPPEVSVEEASTENEDG